MRILLSFLITLCIVCSLTVLLFTVRFVSAFTTVVDVPVATAFPEYHPLDDRKLWTLIQMWRKSEGLKEFKESNTLCSIADKRIVEIQSNNTHEGFYKYAKQTSFNWVSENLSTDFSEINTLDGWLKSASHAAALRDNYPYSCVRCENEYCVQLFAR